MKALFRSKQVVIAVTLTSICLIIYALGLKFLLLPVLIGLGAWLLPLPRIFSSWFGRVIVSFLITFSLIQVAASLQFLLRPRSGFTALATMVVLAHLAVWLLAPKRPKDSFKVISSSDVCALLIIICFFIPFAPILTGHNSIAHIAQIGSVQAIDATNHYASIAELSRAEHLNYAPGYYYPKGFHIAAGFVQESFISSQYSLGWNGNAWLYFTDYLFYGSLLAYILFFICLSWMKSLNEKIASRKRDWTKLLAAACIAPPLIILYLIPFINEGFLSYYYVCITLISGLIFLGELKGSLNKKESSLDLGKDPEGRWWLLAYLILMFGASATWPLLIPPFVLIGAMFLLPSRLNVKIFIARVFTLKGLPIIAAFALQLLPIYYQMKYSSTSTTASLNLTGGLKQFHPYVILFGLAIILAVILSSKVDESFKRLLFNIFMPQIAFLGVLILFQDFTVGSVIYYVIKVSLLVEMLMLAFGVAVLVWVFANSKLYEARYAWLVPVIPLMIILLLISSVDNPLKDVRDIFRNRSNDVIPQYLGEDVQTDVRLGSAGKIKHFNLTVLHYDQANDKFFADMQVPYWADMMGYDASKQDFKAAVCMGDIYSNLAFGTYDVAAQNLLTTQLKTCALNVRRNGGTFYVVTDPLSAPYVRNLLGNLVTIVVD